MTRSMTFEDACNIAMTFARSDGLQRGMVTLTIHESLVPNKYIITIYTTELRKEDKKILELRYKCAILESIIEQDVGSGQIHVDISDTIFGILMMSQSYDMLPMGAIVYDTTSLDIHTIALSIYHKP
jgi:hypothetical protein